MTATAHRKSPLAAPALEHIVEALAALRFGAVEITVHHGRIVQIERREKLRLDERNPARPPSDAPSGDAQ